MDWNHSEVVLYDRVLLPICLGGLVTYFSPGEHGLLETYAYWYAGGLVGCSITMVIGFHGFVLYTMQMGMRIRLSCAALIYQKSMRLRQSISMDGLNGRVINLISSDVTRFDMYICHLNNLWKAPLDLCVLGICIYRQIGVHGLLGIGFLISFIPLQSE